MKLVNDIPRRSQINLLTPVEMAIFKTKQMIEEIGAHPLLTDVVMLLDQAQNKLADHVELDESVPVLTTFQEYLEANIKEGYEFRLCVRTPEAGKTEFYIHPLNRNGDTLDYSVVGNELKCITKVMKS